MDMNLSKLQDIVKDRETWYAPVMGLQRVRHDFVTEQTVTTTMTVFSLTRTTKNMGLMFTVTGNDH